VVANISRRSIEFSTEAGHSETIFDMEYFPGSSKSEDGRELLASCSYDGTVRVWDSNTMKMLTINNTHRNSPQANKPKKIIYSISWHPTEPKIAVVTINGNLMVYDALKAKLLSHICPYENSPSFKVAWNHLEPKNILMSTSQKSVVLIEVVDIDTCKTLTKKMDFFHMDQVFGVDWDPKVSSRFLTGCKDGKMRMFDILNGNKSPIKIFTGHQSRIYNVLFNKQLPHIAVSGSDDCSIRVWDVNQEGGGGAMQVLGGKDVKGSHTNYVRGLAFLPEIAWCLISGSWDS